MKRRTRITLRVAAVLSALVVLAGAWLYVVIWRPHQNLYRDEAWRTSASTNEMRALCHHVISHRPGAPHDAFLLLGRIGNVESVPLLIQALKWQKPQAEEWQVCTIAHGVDALKSLTGEDFGFSSTAWAQWWETIGRTLPRDHFYPRELETENQELE